MPKTDDIIKELCICIYEDFCSCIYDIGQNISKLDLMVPIQYGFTNCCN